MTTPSLRMGTFGPRSAGKTVSLLAWYLRRHGTDIELEDFDPASMTYLRPLAENLTKGKFPPATQAGPPEPLRCSAVLGDKTYRLELIDFAGELTDPVWQAGNEQFHQAVADWFTQCDSILLFIDVFNRDALYLDAIDRLLRELDQQETRHGSRRRAVAVMLTKCDAIPDTDAGTFRDPGATGRLLGGQLVYQRLRRQLERKSESIAYREFVCSAIGWRFAHTSPPEVTPFNLFEALAWSVAEGAKIVDASHDARLGEAERKFETLTRNPGWGLPNYAAMLTELDRLTAAYHLRESPLHGRAAALRADLERKLRMKKAAMRACAFALFLVAAAGAWFVGRKVSSRDYDDYERLAVEARGDEDARARQAFYRSRVVPRRWDWLFGLRDRRRVADARAADDERTVARLDAEAAFAALVAEDARLAALQHSPRRHQNALDYRERHDASTPDDRKSQIREIMRETQAAWHLDRDAWRSADELAVKSPGDYQKKVELFRSYAERPNALTAGEARTEIASLESRESADLSEYSTLVGLARTAVGSAQSADLAVAEQAARNYLTTQSHAGTRSANVADYVRRVDAFQEPRDVRIDVKTVEIPVSFLNRTWTGNPNVTVTVRIGEQEWKASERAATPATGKYTCNVGQQLGPYRVAWGTEQKLTIRLTNNRSVFESETAEWESPVTPSPLDFANRANIVPGNGSSVTVELACPAATPPGLQE